MFKTWRQEVRRMFLQRDLKAAAEANGYDLRFVYAIYKGG